MEGLIKIQNAGPSRVSYLLRQQGFQPEMGSSGRYAVFSLCSTAPLPAWFSWQYLHGWIQLEEIARANRPTISLHSCASCDSQQYQFPCGQIRAKSISRISRRYVRSILALVGMQSVQYEPIVDSHRSWMQKDFLVLLDMQSQTHYHQHWCSLAEWTCREGERHREVLAAMLPQYDAEHPFPKVLEIWAMCTQAKNLLSSRAGFAPEVLVLGKQIFGCQYPFAVMPLQMQNTVTGDRSASSLRAIKRLKGEDEVPSPEDIQERPQRKWLISKKSKVWGMWNLLRIVETHRFSL